MIPIFFWTSMTPSVKTILITRRSWSVPCPTTTTWAALCEKRTVSRHQMQESHSETFFLETGRQQWWETLLHLYLMNIFWSLLFCHIFQFKKKRSWSTWSWEYINYSACVDLKHPIIRCVYQTHQHTCSHSTCLYAGLTPGMSTR